MGMIRFVVYGKPKAKGRPKFYRRGRWVGVATPNETREYEANFLEQALAYKPKKPLDVPLSVTLDFYMPIPSSGLTKRDRAEAEKETMPVGKKPDIDNMIKASLDALNTIFWQDDRLIANLTASKRYSLEPRTEVKICRCY